MSSSLSGPERRNWGGARTISKPWTPPALSHAERTDGGKYKRLVTDINNLYNKGRPNDQECSQRDFTFGMKRSALFNEMVILKYATRLHSR